MIKRIAAVAALAMWATAPMARELDVNLHDDAAEVGLYFPPTEDMYVEDADLGGSLFFNDDGDVALSGIVHVTGPPAEGFSPLQFGAGAKGYLIYADEPERTVGALALGGSARISIPAQVPQALVFRGHVAPNITAFGRAKRVFEGNIRYELDFTPRASAYLGFRYLRLRMSGGSNQTLDNNLHLGVRVRF